MDNSKTTVLKIRKEVSFHLQTNTPTKIFVTPPVLFTPLGPALPEMTLALYRFGSGARFDRI